MKNFYTICFFYFLFSLNLSAQLSFSDSTSLFQNQNFSSGVAMAVCDMNNDGIDDIVRFENLINMNIEYNELDTFTNFNYGFVSNSEIWSIAVADANGDGYNDIFTGGVYDNVKTIMSNDTFSNYTFTILPQGNIFLQGSNFADIDGDGHLDIFGCHDDAESRIWEGDGSGVFSDAFEWIDMATTPNSDNSGNYGSIWTDFDNDRDLDLYIAKCRIGVNSPWDPRRINALFVNDGNHNYTENAEASNLKIGHQSWAADFNDLDNDGDLDAFIANHGALSQLLINDGRGVFEDKTEEAGINIQANFYQAITRDFDNDGFIDILTSNPCYLLRNNGDGTFTGIEDAIPSDISTFAIGDLNHDGFLDIYAGYPENINDPTDVPDKLWINEGNENNFIAVQLKGNGSNTKGIGARVELYGEWGIQLREVRSGESYGITNSHTQHFGLGSAEQVDFLVVKWPSGIIDVIENPNINHFIEIEEGQSCATPPAITSSEPLVCPNVSFTLSAPTATNYLWGNGMMSAEIELEEVSNYSVLSLDENNCVVSSHLFMVVAEELPEFEISTTVEPRICLGENIELTATQADSYLWSTGDTTQSITVDSAGEYYASTNSFCGLYSSEPITIEVFQGIIPEIENDTIDAPGMATLTATGDEPHWYDTPDPSEPIAPLGTGNEFTTPFLEENTTYYVEDWSAFGQETATVGMQEHAGSSYSGPLFNAALIFDVHQPAIIKEVTVFTDFPGERIVEVYDSNDVLLHSKLFNITDGTTVLELGFDFSPGEKYYITTNTEQNQEVFSHNSPSLKRSDNMTAYPYIAEDLITITDSEFGSQYYYYFYDWKVETIATVCISERVPVEVVIDVTNTTELSPFEKLHIHPNPSTGIINLELNSQYYGNTSLSIFDVSGTILFTSVIPSNKIGTYYPIDLSALPGGLYFLKVVNEEEYGREKFIIQR